MPTYDRGRELDGRNQAVETAASDGNVENRNKEGSHSLMIFHIPTAAWKTLIPLRSIPSFPQFPQPLLQLSIKGQEEENCCVLLRNFVVDKVKSGE